VEEEEEKQEQIIRRKGRKVPAILRLPCGKGRRREKERRWRAAGFWGRGGY